MNRIGRIAGLASAVLLTALLAAAPAWAQNSNNVSLSRSVSGTVAEGETISVTVTITSAPPEGSGPILALSLRETLPAGLTFQNIASSTDDQQPAIRPGANAVGELEFAWISVPKLPYSMTYAATVGTGFVSPSSINGQVEYRALNSAQFSNVATTTVEFTKKEIPLWKLILLFGCAPGDGPVGSPFGDWLVVGLVLAVLAGSRSGLFSRLAVERVRGGRRF